MSFSKKEIMNALFKHDIDTLGIMLATYLDPNEEIPVKDSNPNGDYLLTVILEHLSKPTIPILGAMLVDSISGNDYGGSLKVIDTLMDAGADTENAAYTKDGTGMDILTFSYIYSTSLCKALPDIEDKKAYINRSINLISHLLQRGQNRAVIDFLHSKHMEESELNKAEEEFIKRIAVLLEANENMLNGSDKTSYEYEI